MLKNHNAQADLSIGEFVDSITLSAKDVHETVHEALQSLSGNLLSVKIILKNSASDIFAGINQAAKAAHRRVKPQVLLSWESTYAKCGATKGTDVFKTNKETHKKHVNGDGGLLMYKQAGLAMKETLSTELDKLEDKFHASFQAAVARIREDLKVMLDRHSLSTAKTRSPEAETLAKEKLQKALKPHFDALSKAWVVEAEIEADDSEETESASELDDSESELDSNSESDSESDEEKANSAKDDEE